MAHTTDGWTLDELHRLPDDGNKYELVRGELFVTPPPSVHVQSVASRAIALCGTRAIGLRLDFTDGKTS